MGPSDTAARWGTNQVAATVSLSGADCLYSTFDASVGGNEADLSRGDSGGASFIQDGGIWKLAGINHSVDGLCDYDDVVNPNEFNAALYDSREMYVGSDASCWTLVEGEPVSRGFYSTRISSYHEEITAITAIPEPGSTRFGCMALFVLIRRKR